MTFAHAGQAPAPHDLWGAWNLDPLLVVALLACMWLYRRGWTRGRSTPQARRQAWHLALGLGVLAISLLSPLEALSAALASAHMVQHILIVLVVAPLLVASDAGVALLRGSPAIVRRAVSRWHNLRLANRMSTALREPVTLWLLHAGTLWVWHARVLYDAALEDEAIHALEHLMFLATGFLFWRVLIGRSRDRVSPGFGVLLVFGMAMQSVFLAALLTFARTPWYSGYASTTTPWGVEPLSDQQLAGVIMWIPGGMVYVATALVLLVTWLRSTEAADTPPRAFREDVARLRAERTLDGRGDEVTHV